jgi:electron transport complex protein RnfC
MIVHSFHGGIHPPDNKHFTNRIPFKYLSIPQKSFIPLQQHIGKPATPVVEAGQLVEEGQLIGQANGLISANVHATVPGKVVEITEYHTPYSEHGLCVVIESDGSFNTSGKVRQKNDFLSLDKEALIEKVQSAGIVGLGGAAFPTAVKLNPPANRTIDTLIINGSECEPYLTVDDMLMQTHPEEIIEGIQIAMKILGINKAYLGIEKNKPLAIKALQTAVANVKTHEIVIIPLNKRYPQGAEKQLIYTITKREVPSGGLPMDVHVVVQNVGTIYAIREAVLFDKPLIERYITVTGKIVRKPGNYKVRFGMRVSDILEECGGLVENPSKIIMGGPMCGLALNHMDIPVVKGTSGILFLAKNETKVTPFRSCIRCGRCVSVCPMNLIPCDLGNAAEKQRYDIAEKLHPFDCIMCGSCSYICPSKRPLSHFIKVVQTALSAKR